MKISLTVLELLSGHEMMTDGRTDKQTDGQGDYYRASADFVWWGPNNNDYQFDNL